MGLAFLALYATPVAWLAAPIALMLGFGTYLLHNTLQTHGTQMAPEARGAAMALFALCLFVGQAIGVPIAAPIVDRWGAPPVFWAAAIVLPLLALWFVAALRRHQFSGDTRN